MAKIFVLEDDEDIREVITWILEAEHYEVCSFDTVNDFIGRDNRVLPDLYILDVMLPDGSGLEVCNQLRLKNVNSHIPIVIISAHASVRQVAAGCAADDFIQKPFELGFFLHKIKEQLNKNTFSNNS